MNHTIQIKQAGRDNMRNLSAFLNECWRAEYRQIVSDETLDTLSVEERHERLLTRYDGGASEFLMMTKGNQLIGASVYGKSFTEGYEADGEISAIYLHKEYIGKGFGHTLFTKTEQRLAAKGYTHFVLDVLSANARAVSFYEKHGYTKVDDRSIKLGECDYPLAVFRKQHTAQYITLLRGINVGGKNIIKMSDLKAAFQRRGFQHVVTCINSGNVLFDCELDETAAKTVCEELISEDFGLDIPVCVISAAALTEALAHAPDWWGTDPESRHNALFVIPPMTTEEMLAQIGAVKPEYERIGYYGKVIFWSAPIATFSRTRLTKIVQSKAAYNAITVRNANTAIKLAELAGGKKDEQQNL